MKIYLLMLLISAILAAVHLTAAPDPRSKPQPQ